jgi:hypothetical protein
MDYQARKSAWSKTGQLLTVAAFAFLLGMWSVDFRGGGLAWTAVILAVVALALNLYLLVLGFWKANT